MEPPPVEPLAKSSGVTLKEHTRHVRERAKENLEARPFVRQKYSSLTGDDLALLLDVASRWHDVGKLHPRWQSACVLEWKKVPGDHLRRADIRHEIASLHYARQKGVELPLVARVAIAAHHGKLSKKHERRWEKEDAFKALWLEFCRESSFTRPHEGDIFEQVLKRRYACDGPRALLQLADHFASAAEDLQEIPSVNPFDYKFREEWTRRPMQEESFLKQFWDEPFAILRAPTGAGKTDAALLWAQRQIEQGRADRLVIAMPTRFTANALSVATANTLSQTGLYHSSALFHRVGESDLSFDERSLLDKEQELARKLETPVTVTTIDHLCVCLTGTREDHHATLWGLSHSCVVIDEADFYDAWTQSSLVVLLRALRLLNVPVLLMSATVPESARELYERSGFTVPDIYEDKSDLTRVRCVVKRVGICVEPRDIKQLLQRALNGEPMIIYANTVRRAQDYHRWFMSQFEERNEPERRDDVVLYHSRFIEAHKVQKEEKLRVMLGPDAWKNGTARGVAILTQIGEMSVNISANVMISELCPLDRLTQRAGRLARFPDANGNWITGELHIVEPHRRNTETGETIFYPAPYGHFQLGSGWQMSRELEKSSELLQEEQVEQETQRKRKGDDAEYSAQKFIDLVNKLYPVTEDEASDARENRRALENCFIINWLILPAEEKKPEEGEDERTKDWKCRDIPPQVTVWANYQLSAVIDSDAGMQSFSSWFKFRQTQQRHGISIYAYEFKQALENGFLEEVTFVIGREDKDDKETAYIVRSNYYNDRLGLYFTDDAVEPD